MCKWLCRSERLPIYWEVSVPHGWFIGTAADFSDVERRPALSNLPLQRAQARVVYVSGSEQVVVGAWYEL